MINDAEVKAGTLQEHIPVSPGSLEFPEEAPGGTGQHRAELVWNRAAGMMVWPGFMPLIPVCCFQLLSW